MNRSILVSLSVFGIALCSQGGYPSDLVFYSKLDATTDITLPQVGEPGTDDGATFQAGKIGNALYVPAHGAVATFSLPKGLPSDAFCIEFYAKLLNANDSFVVGTDPYLFGIRKSGKGASVLELHFNANNGMNKSGLVCGIGYGYCFATWNTFADSIPYANVLGASDPKGWHKYSIRWNKSGLNGSAAHMAVYIDDVEHSKGFTSETEYNAFSSKLGDSLDLILSNYLGSSDESKSPFLIDEFKIWKTDTPKEDVELPVVSAVTAKQHYPWCGKIDIGYAIAGATDGLSVKITVRDNDNDVTYEAKTFDVNPSAAEGAHTVVWDATKDGVDKVSKNMVATVSLVVP